MLQLQHKKSSLEVKHSMANHGNITLHHHNVIYIIIQMFILSVYYYIY
uniref:Uncharacterized protein n=1 Tax=Anguilla anguilla TaxID=7936 RepID=A0A0E9XQX7_ANGAN